MSVRVRALVEYDGTDYAGFQYQPKSPTIQGELEAALRRLTTQETRIVGAGRTDAGVHAEGQVIAFSTDWRHPLEDLQRGLNALLPKAIVVREMEPAAERFHPRFDARSRRYRYQILNQPLRSPLLARFASHVPRALDMARMEQATQCLIGSADFATFGQPTQGESTIRRMIEITWSRQNSLICMEIEANAFLRNMVRCIMGTALLAGLGEIDPIEFEERFRACDRSRSGAPAPPEGLCLLAVRY